jgi:exoribonuclease R
LLNTALNGDLVEVSVEEKRVQGKLSKEGRVVKVIKRAKENFVGITKLEGNTLVVVPDDKKMYTNFVIQNADNKSIGVSENFAASKISAIPVADVVVPALA